MVTKNFIDIFFKKKLKKNILILSGGRSVKGIYKKIYKSKICWSKTKIFILDERLTKLEKNLNSNMIKKIFKKKCEICDIYKNKVKSNCVAKMIKKNNSLVILGMGEDGHFASIFARSKKFKHLINLSNKPGIHNVEKIGKPLCKRVTMNLSMINLSLKIILVISSKKRLEIFKKFIKFPDKKIPIIHLIKHNKKKILINFKNNIVNFNNFRKLYDF